MKYPGRQLGQCQPTASWSQDSLWGSDAGTVGVGITGGTQDEGFSVASHLGT